MSNSAKTPCVGASISPGIRLNVAARRQNWQFVTRRTVKVQAASHLRFRAIGWFLWRQFEQVGNDHTRQDSGPRANLFLERLEGLVERQDFLVFRAQAPHRDGAIFDFALADGEQHGDLRDAVFAHLV